MPFSATRRLVLFVFAAACALNLRADWTPIVAPTTEDLWGLCYGTTQFVAVGTAGTILTSPTGTTWTARTSGTTAWLTAVGYAPDRALYVAVGDRGTLLTSSDALVWTPRTSGTTQRLNNIAYAAGRWIAVGEAGTVCTSTDADAWTATTLPLDTWLRGLCYGPDSFLIGAGDGTLCSTEDGTHFRYHGKIKNDLSPLPQSVETLFYTNSLTFAAGSNGGILSSTDRVNWATKVGGGSPTYRGLAKSYLNVIAVGTDGASFQTLYASALGSPQYTSTIGAANLNAIVLGPPGSVTVGDHGTIYLSPSAPLTPQSTGGGLVAPSVAYTGGTLTLAPEFSGTPPFTFQWSRSGHKLPGATSEALVLKDYSWAASGGYTLTIKNSVGTVAIDLNVPAPLAPPSTVVDTAFTVQLTAATAATVAPLPHGRFLIASSAGLVRFNADGSWDLSFHPAAVGEFVVPADEKYLVYRAGRGADSLIRLRADGARDTSFTCDGDYGQPLPLAGGQILCLAIRADPAVRVTRLTSTGAIDPTFGAYSLALTNGLGSAGRSILTTIDDQNRIYLAASSNFVRFSSEGGADVFRLHPDGSRDVSFVSLHLSSVVKFRWAQGKLCYEIDGDPWHPNRVYRQFGRLTETGKPDPTFTNFFYYGDRYPSAGPLPPIGDFDANGELFVIRQTLRMDYNFWEDSFLAHYRPDGGMDPEFSARFASRAISFERLVALDDGSFLLSGTFASLNGHPTAGLARIRPTTDAYATRLANLSLRTTAGTGDQTLIAGFVVAGDASRSVLLRAVGPGLIPLGLGARDILADPQLTLHRGSATLAANDDWDFSLDATATALGAFPLTRSSKDAALLAPLAPGVYSALVNSSNSSSANTSGLALIELYDADPAPTSASSPRLVNLSGRARVGTGDNVLIAGFVIAGHSTKRVLIRAVGPTLLNQGVADALPDPILSVHRGDEKVGENDDSLAWIADVSSAVGAFPLNVGSKDAALVLDLPPGVYTAVVKGANATTGTALVEIYEVP